MGTTTNIYLAIAVMIVATQLSRLGPLLLSDFKFSKAFERWLTHVPIAILAALIIPEFIIPEKGDIKLNKVFIVPALFCLGVGLKTKNLLLTTLTGVLFVALIRALT